MIDIFMFSMIVSMW